MPSISISSVGTPTPAINGGFIQFARPDLGEAEIAAAVRVLEGGWLTTGPEASAFEQEFSSLFRAGAISVAVNSATAGLHLALEACGIGAGDEVLVPTLTFTATAEVVEYLGATPVLVDIDPDTLCISLADAAQRLTSRTKAIMPVHYAGHACAMSEILRFAKQHGLRVIDDAAHALPTRSQGTLVGDFDTDATVFSFYANKTLCTGEGGMIVTRRPEVAERARRMRLHGISRDAFDRFRTPGASWSYDVVAAGFKYNLTDLAAAIGRVQLSRLGEMHTRRVAVAKAYCEGLQGTAVGLPPMHDGAESHAWQLFVIRLPTHADRDRFIAGMTERGIGTSVHYVPLHELSHWRAALDPKFPGFAAADSLSTHIVSLPMYPGLSSEDIERVIEAVRSLVA